MPLYTQSYIEQNAQLHARDPNYGTGGAKVGPLIGDLVRQHGFRTILDYGCGKQRLRDAVETLGIRYQGYDPAIPGLQAAAPADLVVCGDVMEHVEPDFVGDVLGDVLMLANRAALFVICCEPGTRRLPNGDLSHCSVHPPAWWCQQLRDRGASIETLPALDAGQIELVALAWVSNPFS